MHVFMYVYVYLHVCMYVFFLGGKGRPISMPIKKQPIWCIHKCDFSYPFLFFLFFKFFHTSNNIKDLFSLP